MDFRDTTVEQLARAIRTGERAAEQLAEATMARIEQENPQYNAFVALVEHDQVLAAARAIDQRVAAGEDPGPLAGIPVGVKDLEDVAGLRTTFGSRLHAEQPPAAQDSIGVQRLRTAGALIVGKTNTAEFGCKGSTDNLLFGPTRNPWNTAYCAGGSSGGSAAALAAGLVPLATGSDGGGSIRIPASACGLSGFKPATGRVPGGDAAPPVARTLESRGPMARTIRDTVLALDVMRGDAATDIFALPGDHQDWLQAWTAGGAPRRVLWAPTLGYAYGDDNVRAVCEAALERLRAVGIQVIEHDAIIAEHPLPHWWAMWTAGLACTLGEHVDSERFQLMEPVLQHMVKAGLQVSGTDYARALDACHNFNYQLEQAFAKAPLLLTPTCAGRVPKSCAAGTINGEETHDWIQMTFGFNMSRNPAASIHAGLNADGLPVGLQVIGRQRHDLATLIGAGAIEQILGGPGRPELAS
ncbi:MAG TPA: amidase [Salinisphaeraceae bacterium]|nr:amidase [Salinisphaeraceae bacterium]